MLILVKHMGFTHNKFANLQNGVRIEKENEVHREKYDKYS
jgi:hypothetical protein